MTERMVPTVETERRLRDLPSVQRVMAIASVLAPGVGADAVREASRAALEEERQALMRGSAVEPSSEESLGVRASTMLAAIRRTGRQRIINATGILVHTNFGRAPLAREAAAAAEQIAGGYSNLEFDLVTGARGARGAAVEALLVRATGADAALIVNNNAAAVLLALSALAPQAEVIVSRGELVEIGGGFRIPDVVAQGGARLVEVGSTNRTNVQDYSGAITSQTRAILKVHPSNYRVTGFTSSASIAELAELSRAHGLSLIHDLGSGALVDIPGETTPRSSIAAGADVVTFSGDKLLGGPQAGILVGRATAIDGLRRHPLMRALRTSKLTLAALEATLELYDRGTPNDVPVIRMLRQSEAQLRARGERLLALLAERDDFEMQLVETSAYAGGGVLPDRALVSVAVAVTVKGRDAAGLSARLRGNDPAIIGRLSEGRLLLDLFAVQDAELPLLAAALMRPAD
jgi:L-seryl-tRNA(Ser) seleniumtransferase